MKTIWKYEINWDEIEIEMPKKAQVLTVQMQGDKPVIWAMVDDANSKEARYFRLIGTGHPVDKREILCYISTFQTANGLVFHVFEITNK